MNKTEIDEILKSTLEDALFSRAEKSALKSLLADSMSTSEELSFFRNRVFYVARNALAEHDATAVFKWLEGVNKTIHERLAMNLTSTAETFFSPGLECRHAIQSCLRRAKSSVDICVFTITDNEITEVIAQTHERKIQVRIITDDDKSSDRGSDIDRLEQLGIPIKKDSTRYHMHHKYAVFDRSILLSGSYNWTRGAADYNQENISVTDDSRLVVPYIREFERLWSQF